jgi:PAS domain S-box-containing protein
MPEPADQRASPRIDHRTDLTITLEGRQDHRRAKMHNYSTDGLYFVTSDAYQPGDQLQLTMDHHDPAAQGPEAFKSYVAEVRTCRKLPNDKENRFGVSVCFLFRSLEDIHRLAPGYRSVGSGEALRKRAERILADQGGSPSETGHADPRQLLHELRVHQIELQMQNEELRRAQGEIETALAQYTDLYDFAPVSYFTLDSKGLILKMNLTGTSLLGVERDRLIGKPFGYFVAKEDQDLFWLHRQAVIDSRLRQSTILNLKRKDGRPIAVFIESSPLPRTEPIDGGIFSAVIDITERKKAEAEIKRLEACVTEAKKMKIIATLAGGVAHNFNNLLMGIQGYVSLMQDDFKHTQHYARYFNDINGMIRSAADLTQQLLGFAQGGKYDVRPIDMNTRIAGSAKLYNHTRKDITIDTNLQEDLWAVAADRSQIDQVLLNLFLNAGDAMPNGGHLEIRTTNVVLQERPESDPQLAPGKYVQITVSDTGVGMDEATLERIFEPFFTTKTIGQGTGLGLASVYGIIHNHKGHIQVSSKPGEGSTFLIHLPAATDDVQDVPAAPLQILRGTETLLLVDDEVQVRAVGAMMARRLGYEVILAESGQDAIEQFSQNRDRIDLVLLDMTMPGMSSDETYDYLRKLQPGVKVLLASGYNQEGAPEDILQRGCQGFIQKPYTLEELSQALRMVLDAN